MSWNADGVIGIGITATALGLVAAGVAAAVTRRWKVYSFTRICTKPDTSFNLKNGCLKFSVQPWEKCWTRPRNWNQTPYMVLHCNPFLNLGFQNLLVLICYILKCVSLFIWEIFLLVCYFYSYLSGCLSPLLWKKFPPHLYKKCGETFSLFLEITKFIWLRIFNLSN